MKIKSLLCGVVLSLSSYLAPAQEPLVINPLNLHQLKQMQKVFENVYKVTIDYEVTRKGVVTGMEGSCSAYNYRDVDGKSYYLTAAHCFHDDEGLVIKKIVLNNGGEDLEAKLLFADKNRDYALVQSVADKVKPITKILKDAVIGEEVYMVGYPMGAFKFVKRANLAAVVTDGDQEAFVYDEHVMGGCSGGGVFVQRGSQIYYAGIINGLGGEPILWTIGVTARSVIKDE